MREKEMKQMLIEAEALIERACEIMDADQVGQWQGVRAWLEQMEPQTKKLTKTAEEYDHRHEPHEQGCPCYRDEDHDSKECTCRHRVAVHAGCCPECK